VVWSLELWKAKTLRGYKKCPLRFDFLLVASNFCFEILRIAEVQMLQQSYQNLPPVVIIISVVLRMEILASFEGSIYDSMSNKPGTRIYRYVVLMTHCSLLIAPFTGTQTPLLIQIPADSIHARIGAGTSCGCCYCLTFAVDVYSSLKQLKCRSNEIMIFIQVNQIKVLDPSLSVLPYFHSFSSNYCVKNQSILPLLLQLLLLR
jgi:hypothetical protein